MGPTPGAPDLACLVPPWICDSRRDHSKLNQTTDVVTRTVRLYAMVPGSRSNCLSVIRAQGHRPYTHTHTHTNTHTPHTHTHCTYVRLRISVQFLRLLFTFSRGKSYWASLLRKILDSPFTSSDSSSTTSIVFCNFSSRRSFPALTACVHPTPGAVTRHVTHVAPRSTWLLSNLHHTVCALFAEN